MLAICTCSAHWFTQKVNLGRKVRESTYDDDDDNAVSLKNVLFKHCYNITVKTPYFGGSWGLDHGLGGSEFESL